MDGHFWFCLPPKISQIHFSLFFFVLAILNMKNMYLLEERVMEFLVVYVNFPHFRSHLNRMSKLNQPVKTGLISLEWTLYLFPHLGFHILSIFFFLQCLAHFHNASFLHKKMCWKFLVNCQNSLVYKYIDKLPIITMYWLHCCSSMVACCIFLILIRLMPGNFICTKA